MSQLSLKQANTIIERAFAKAREMKIIKDAQGAIIGAAGGSGGTGEEDEVCCVAGIEAAGLKADASA